MGTIFFGGIVLLITTSIAFKPGAIDAVSLLFCGLSVVVVFGAMFIAEPKLNDFELIRIKRAVYFYDQMPLANSETNHMYHSVLPIGTILEIQATVDIGGKKWLRVKAIDRSLEGYIPGDVNITYKEKTTSDNSAV